MSDFYKYFKENMDGLGLPAPESLFGNLHRPWLPSIMMRHPEIYKKRRVVQTRRGP